MGAEEEKARYETFEAKLKEIEEEFQKNETVGRVQDLEKEAYGLMEKERRKYFAKFFGASKENKEQENEEEDVEKQLNEIEEDLEKLQEAYKNAVNEKALEIAKAQDIYYQNDDKKFENAKLFQQRFNEILTKQEEGEIDEESVKNDFYTLYEDIYKTEALEKLKEYEAKVQEQMKVFQEQMKVVEEEDKEMFPAMMEMVQKMFQNETQKEETNVKSEE